MNVLTDQNWALSVGTFLPLAGVIVMLFIPRTEETLHKGVALVKLPHRDPMKVVAWK